MFSQAQLKLTKHFSATTACTRLQCLPRSAFFSYFAVFNDTPHFRDRNATRAFDTCSLQNTHLCSFEPEKNVDSGNLITSETAKFVDLSHFLLTVTKKDFQKVRVHFV